MKLDEEQRAEVQQAAKIWRSYLGNDQANVILTPARKQALATLVALAELALASPPESSQLPPEASP